MREEKRDNVLHVSMSQTSWQKMLIINNIDKHDFENCNHILINILLYQLISKTTWPKIYFSPTLNAFYN